MMRKFIERYPALTIGLLLAILIGNNCLTFDENGYIIYCPCMGRFGNQAEQFLGSLLFAIDLNRTLVLPPFIEYNDKHVNFTPFDKYFRIEPLLEKHRVLTMENFMFNYAPTIWPREERFILCYSARGGRGESDQDCNPFEGNPFKPFWYHFNVTKFVRSLLHSPLATQFTEAKYWKAPYKNIKVLAFVGAPSPFPTSQEAIPLQRHVKFSDYVGSVAEKFRLDRGFVDDPYLAIHMRHGSDWMKACNLLKENDMTQLFSSDQCTRRIGVEVKLPYQICTHSTEQIVSDVRRALNDLNKNKNSSVIYISTDNDDKPLWRILSSKFPEQRFITPTATYSNGASISEYSEHPHFIIDAYLLSNADYFLGNCISSFSAFASRIRIYSYQRGRTTRFFANDLLKQSNNLKDEL
ncbi:O-fucosyltransferase 1 isoform X1 [Brevipalpus obovatus]|uniref:O-fucosyltransferase 1 isoform X1 n=1 Tax=Brevipalpus obovatus TaxID=246614 RepID=UPI003D9EC853